MHSKWKVPEVHSHESNAVPSPSWRRGGAYSADSDAAATVTVRMHHTGTMMITVTVTAVAPLFLRPSDGAHWQIEGRAVHHWPPAAAR